VISGKYVVESLLGAGGMGVVVSARHVHLNQSVAIKLLRPGAAVSSTSRLLREARAAASIRSEHVARVLDVGTLDSGLPFIVMERLHGCDLSALLEARGRVPYAEAVSLLLQACEAIGEAHALGIVHRDLKPSNLFVTTRADGSPLVKVLDFGISKMQSPISFAGADPTLTASGSVLGSPAYMSPEQIRSVKGTDARSDIWAMGVILYELITGRGPFIGETLGDTLVKIASEPAAPLRSIAPEVPEGLANVVAGCLVRDTAARTASIPDLARALQPFAAEDMSAFVERIVKVAATTRPVLSATPDEGEGAAVSEPARPADPQRTEGVWQRASESPRRRGNTALWMGAVLLVGAVGAAAWTVRLRSPAASPEPDAIRADAASMPPVDAASVAVAAPPLPANPPEGARDAGTAAPADSALPSARPGHAPERTKGRRGIPGAPPPSTSPGPSASAPRSLDDLLEGRH
jgi:serine/threonine-protein kinase